MPSTRPCAAFEPISPDFDLNALVESTPNFEYAIRIHSDMIDHHGLASFERLVLMHVILGGKPLVIEGYESRLDRWIFAVQWLRDNCGSTIVDARDLTKQVNVPMSIGHYLKHMSLLTNQWTAKNYKDPERQRMYLKDIDCPQIWQERLREHIPPVLFYLNESTGDIGGLGAVEESGTTLSASKKGRGVAKAGDLMSSLRKDMRAENLMCYIGHEGTYTPAHREMCASLGHNIMVEASTGVVEDGKPTKPGSSIWFMTETKEREVVGEYWLSRLGHDIEVEKHFAQINAWKNAPFTTYVVDQRPGDFILIPPLAPHQVWNRGTRTMKIAWNRTTIETLEMAMNEALFKARMVCRDEQYKNKAIIFFSLEKYSKLLQTADKLKQKNPSSKRVQKADGQVRQLQKDFKRLHALFTQILVSESFFPDRAEKKVEMEPFDSNITCSYCRCNIFNRFLTCPSCIGDLPDGEKDTYDICLECYAMGRSCACISKLKWVEQHDWGQLVHKHEQWRHLIIQREGEVTERSPKSLKHELDQLERKRTLAQICQTELQKRPWRDITKPPPRPDAVDIEEDVQVDVNGFIKKKRVKKKSEKFIKEHGRCHVDCYWEPKWKQAQCSKCQKNYCYGILFRAYDMMPQDVMADPKWKCPSCLKICNCRNCINKPGYKRYTPKGTLLGHSTKNVADPRSVESLVDFSFSNIQWIKKADDDHDAEDTRRMLKRRREAEAAMNRNIDLGDHYVDENEVEPPDVEDGILRLAEQEEIPIPIDPTLGPNWTAVNGPASNESTIGDEVEENPEQLIRRANGTENDVQTLFTLPDGGIVQDPERAYDSTDFITFTYPEPGINLQVPPAPVEGYQEAVEFPSQELDVPSPGAIEMIDRKRKRKLDDGDKAFQFKHQSKSTKSNTKKRRSLVVRLSLSKEKLQQINTASPSSRPITGDTAIPAPVVSSDLQALNTENPNTTGQPASKKQRREDPVELKDIDDEYAPGRARDRKKLPNDEAPVVVPETDSSRRITRLHHVTYAEPDEDEFDEIIPTKSKLATMEGASTLKIVTDKKYDRTQMNGNQPAEVETLASPDTSVRISAPIHSSSPHSANESPVEPKLVKIKKSRLASAGLDLVEQNTSTKAPKRDRRVVEAEARANKRAKMAAIDMMDTVVIDDYSTDESIEIPDLRDVEMQGSQNEVFNQKSKQKPVPARDSVNSTQPHYLGKRKDNVGKTVPASVKSAPKIIKPQEPVAASTHKASTDDWTESDSGDEDIPYR